LTEMASANEELRRLLEQQAREVQTLEGSSRAQQVLVRQFERQEEVHNVEARVRAEIAEEHGRLQSEIQSEREASRRERDVLLQRVHEAEGNGGSAKVNAMRRGSALSIWRLS